MRELTLKGEQGAQYKTLYTE